MNVNKHTRLRNNPPFFLFTIFYGMKTLKRQTPTNVRIIYNNNNNVDDDMIIIFRSKSTIIMIRIIWTEEESHRMTSLDRDEINQ